MKHLLPLIFFLAIFGATSACNAEPPKNTVAQMVKAGATLLDVRTAEEFSQGHLPGALNISVAVLAQQLERIPKDKPVVVYCRSGSRSARAARMLQAQGYKVFDLGPMRNGL